MNSSGKFFSNSEIVNKKFFNQNLQKLTFQRKSIKDIEKKHKEWSKIILENN